MNVQALGHIYVGGKKVLVLRRMRSHKVYHCIVELKRRQSGQAGEHFDEDEKFLLDDNEQRVNELLAGKVIRY